MFIYAITNDVTDKVYVGLYSGKYLHRRWAVHLSLAKSGSSYAIHAAMRKYGIEKFHIIPIWSGHIFPDRLKQLEQYYIRSFQCKSPNGYNLTNGGDGIWGLKHSEATRQLLRERILPPITEATRKRLSLARRGNKNGLGTKHTQDTINRRRAARAGYRHSEETRKKIAASNRIAMLGVKPSEETKIKMGLAHKGFRHTEATKRKISETKRMNREKSDQ